MVVEPEYVLAPDKVQVPVPFLSIESEEPPLAFTKFRDIVAEPVPVRVRVLTLPAVLVIALFVFENVNAPVPDASNVAPP